MARAQAGTAKHQSKLLKASGLQKLKFYCQLCQKQCRDANGFKSHLGSPSHLGRVSNISLDGRGSTVVQEFLREFEREFLRLLKINHGTKKVDANKFYQEYILYDKNHVHMNATRWTSLTSFVKHLGRLGKVRVDTDSEADEFNLSILYVDDSFQQLGKDLRQLQLKTDEDSAMKFVNGQIEAGKKLEQLHNENDNLRRGDGDLQDNLRKGEQNGDVGLRKTAKIALAPVKLSLKGLKANKNASVVSSVFGEESDDD